MSLWYFFHYWKHEYTGPLTTTSPPIDLKFSLQNRIPIVQSKSPDLDWIQNMTLSPTCYGTLGKSLCKLQFSCSLNGVKTYLTGHTWELKNHLLYGMHLTKNPNSQNISFLFHSFLPHLHIHATKFERKWKNHRRKTAQGLLTCPPAYPALSSLKDLRSWPLLHLNPNCKPQVSLRETLSNSGTRLAPQLYTPPSSLLQFAHFSNSFIVMVGFLWGIKTWTLEADYLDSNSTSSTYYLYDLREVT